MPSEYSNESPEVQPSSNDDDDEQSGVHRVQLPFVVQHGSLIWLLNRHREYDGPFSYAELVLAAKDRKEWLKENSVELYSVSESGTKVSLRPPAEIQHAYGQLASAHNGHYMARATTYDPATRTITCAPLKWQPLAAKHHPWVEQWLQALGGEHYPQLVQWLASCVQLDRPAPLLYLYGRRGVGKELLARGIAALWGTTAGAFKEAFSEFNGSLATCPLLFADEGFPDNTDFDELRSCITRGHVRINEKHEKRFTLGGYVRLYLSANNDEAFRWQRVGSLSQDDIDAIVERLLVIRIADPGAATEVLAGAKPDPYDDNILPQQIAEHIWHLSQTVALQPPSERMAARSVGGRRVILRLAASRDAELIHYLGTREYDTAPEKPCAAPAVFMSDDGSTIYIHPESFLTSEGQLLDAASSIQLPKGTTPERLRRVCSLCSAEPASVYRRWGPKATHKSVRYYTIDCAKLREVMP